MDASAKAQAAAEAAMRQLAERRNQSAPGAKAPVVQHSLNLLRLYLTLFALLIHLSIPI